MQNTKNIFLSRTIWFNILTIVVVGATLFGYTPNEALAENVSGILVALSPFINIALRYVTKSSVTILPK